MNRLAIPCIALCFWLAGNSGAKECIAACPGTGEDTTVNYTVSSKLSESKVTIKLLIVSMGNSKKVFVSKE